MWKDSNMGSQRTKEIVKELAEVVRPDAYRFTKATCPPGTKWHHVRREQERYEAIVESVLIALERQNYRIFYAPEHLTEANAPLLWRIKPLFPFLDAHAELRKKFFMKGRTSAKLSAAIHNYENAPIKSSLTKSFLRKVDK